ncbi:hypothetical protein BGX31_009742 [Mortierella sp. GBA43]|nr:hypothetical protein BGX31_009742 [Mortierella sp. GBA43]
MFIGNSGVGKSTLLSQLGGNFSSGFSFMEGFTKDIVEQQGTLNGHPVILIDIPGLYESNNRATRLNGAKLMRALSKGYNYNLFFVLSDNNRGPSSEDLALMSKVSDCVRQVSGAKVTIDLIINQIRDEVNLAYWKYLIDSKELEKKLSSPKLDGLDINYSNTTFLMFDRDAVAGNEYEEVLCGTIKAQRPTQIHVVKEIVADNHDYRFFVGLAAGIAATTAAFTAVVLVPL